MKIIRWEWYALRVDNTSILTNLYTCELHLQHYSQIPLHELRLVCHVACFMK